MTSMKIHDTLEVPLEYTYMTLKYILGLITIVTHGLQIWTSLIWLNSLMVIWFYVDSSPYLLLPQMAQKRWLLHQWSKVIWKSSSCIDSLNPWHSLKFRSALKIKVNCIARHLGDPYLCVKNLGYFTYYHFAWMLCWEWSIHFLS